MKVITRREILRRSSLILTGGICFCQQARGEAQSEETCCGTPLLEMESLLFEDGQLVVNLEKAVSLRTKGSAAGIILPERGLDIIIVHESKNNYVVLSALCTHAWRPLSYLKKRRILMCNNFNHSIFDLEGKVLRGPAGAPLKLYPTRLRHGQLEIALKEVRS